MCKHCQLGAPISYAEDGEGVDSRIVIDDGEWFLEMAAVFDGGYISGVAMVPIVACPMCGRALKAKENDESD